MKGMILAAGLGSRLGALSDELPKPLVPVANVPVIRYAVDLLARAGVRELVVNLFHLGDLIEAELGARAHGADIAYSREAPAILGTGGGIKQALARGLLPRGEPFIAANGKIVFDLDVPAVIEQHRRSGALATLVVREDAEARRWGAISIEGERVVGILDHGRRAADHMFTGVHVIEPALIDRLPDGEACILRQGYIPALLAGAPLGAYVARGYFHEHSTPARYLEGNLNVLAGAARTPDPLMRIDPTARVDPGADIGADVVIGAHAHIGAVRLRRAVVWPGARVDRDADGAIITPRTRIDV